MLFIDTSDLIKILFLIGKAEDIQNLRVNLAKALDTQEDDLNSDPTRKDFLCKFKDNDVEEIMRHNETLNCALNQVE